MRNVSRLVAAVALALLPFPHSGCSGETGRAAAKPTGVMTPDILQADPMAGFARMAAGEWRLGDVQADRWRWGPGEHSIRVHTEGSDGSGNPWRELVIYFWHPGLGRVCLLGFHPEIPGVGRGVATGAMTMGADRAEAELTLDQSGKPIPARRSFRARWEFDGPDRYHETLLEDSGAGFEPLASWDYVRAERLNGPHPRAGVIEQPPSENLDIFKPLLGRWAGRIAQQEGRAVEVESSIEWVEALDTILWTVTGRSPTGEPELLLDVYLYHDIRTGSPRCLALHASGMVAQGKVSEIADGGLLLNLEGHDGDAPVRIEARLDPDINGSLQARVWSVVGADRAPEFDILFQKLDPESSTLSRD